MIEYEDSSERVWTTSWACSIQGAYPHGNPVLPTDLRFVFPDVECKANNQTFRLIIGPALWGASGRLRFSNSFGENPLVLSDVFFGLQASAAEVVPATNVNVTFSGVPTVAIAAGQYIWSDPFEVPWANMGLKHSLYGRKATVSFHVQGSNSPVSWHSKALRTSYITAPANGAHSADESDTSFTHTSSAWFYLDAFDVADVPGATAIVAFGDSLTDGTGSTINGDDRWPDALCRRLYRQFGNRVSVVNAGIGGNEVLADSLDGGPAALTRLTRDVLSLSNVRGVIWFQGVNDLLAGAEACQIIAGIKQGVKAMRRSRRDIVLVQATLTPLSEAFTAPYDAALLELRRQEINKFIRTSDIFDGVVDFEAAATDPSNRHFLPEFLADSSTGRVDHLHPNRACYLSMADAVDLKVFNISPNVHTSIKSVMG